MNIGKETEYVEFKQSTAELNKRVISIVSILNKHGEGTLYFGVKDNGDVIGQVIGKDTLRDVSRSISGKIKPEIWYEVNRRDSDDGKSFIEVSFSGNNAPYSAEGLYYQRFADEDKKISDAELEKLFRERQKDYSAWENKKSNATINDIDEQLLKRVINEGNDSGHLKHNYAGALDTLGKLGLLCEDKIHLTSAGEVLFSMNKPILLKLAVFATETKDTFIKLEHFEGNIYECIDKSIDFVKNNITYNVVIDGEARRKERPEIPLTAIREIIINAFAHGSYESNTTFEIDIFKDRVFVYSPGLFPLGYKPEDFAYGSQEPVMLNKRIVNVLFKTGRIESFGSGFRRAFEACKAEHVSFDYENTKSGFRFIFYRTLGHINVREMSNTEKMVLNLIKENGYYTAKDIAMRIEKSEKTVYRAIKTLKNLGLIQRNGDDYNGYWIVLDS